MASVAVRFTGGGSPGGAGRPVLARCTERGCAWRWRTGPDRLCPLHQDSDKQPGARAARYGVIMAEMPGEPVTCDDGAS